MTSPAVERWTGLLGSRVGMSAAEIADLHRELLTFCAEHQLGPDALLEKWLDYPELTARRRHDAGTPPNLAVESFLIHNGVNVFGDIVCIPGRPEDLAQQGAQFVPPTGHEHGR
ncbi:MAG TPA: hypothetical protein VMV17_23955 [Streptosporangiaceae bacterium]|nr:hypothetical protein [Streptosporangiaceae bacterium]